MLVGSLWRIALAVACGLGALILIASALTSRRRRSRARIVLSVVLAGALLLIGVTPWLLSVRQTLAHDPAAPPNIANRAAPVAPGLSVYEITNTKATGDTVVALAAAIGTIRWSHVFAGGYVSIQARGPADVIVEAHKVGAQKSDILALRASDGSTLWQRELDGGVVLALEGTFRTRRWPWTRLARRHRRSISRRPSYHSPRSSR